MDIWDGESRSLLRDAGADVDEAGQHVRFPKEMILERIATAPAEFTLHSWNPEKNLHIGGNWMANGTVGSAPHIVGLDGVRRTGDRVGFDDLLKLAHMLNSIHFVGGYPVEPIDIHASVRHIHRRVRCADPDRQAHPLLQPRPPEEPRLHRDGAHRPWRRRRHPRSRAVDLHGDQLQLAAAPRHADAARHHRDGLAQPAGGDDTVHPRRGDGADHARRCARPAERRSAGRHRPVPDRAAGRAGGLRRVHLERRHAIGRAGIRHAGVRAHGDGRRPVGPPLPPAVPQQQRVRRQCRRRPGRLRERVRAVGLRHGRRQHDDARRRLDGGRAARQPGEDGARRRPAAHGVVDDGSGRRRRRHAGHRRHRRGRPRWALLRRRAHAGPLPHRVLQADDQRLAQLRELGGGRAARRPPARPTTLRQPFLAAYEPPEMDAARREELEAFVARRVAEGGVATDF